MTALSAARAMVSDPGAPTPFVNNSQTGVPMAANAVIWAGAIVCIKTDGYATKGTATASLVALGIANESRDNTGGADGALSIPVRRGPWWCVNSDAIDRTNIGGYCYIVDDQTVAKSSSSGARPVAGIVRGIDTTLGVLVDFGVGGIAKPLLPSDIPSQSGGVDRTVRGVVTSNVANLAAFTVASADLTFIEADRVLLTGQTAAAENGIYVCGAVGAGTCALSRPSDFAGTLVQSGLLVQASEGTLYKDTLWFCTTNGAITVDTTALTFSRIATVVSEEARAHRVVRGVVYANVDVANFTMAATDLTFVAGDRALLIGQTTGGANVQNGIYVVGADGSGSGGAGTATLTREPDWRTGTAFGGALITVRAGTVFAGMTIKCTNTGAITVGSTATTFEPVRQKLTVTLIGGTKTINTGIWVTATSKFTAARTAVSGVPGPSGPVFSGVVAGLPGTGTFVLTVGTLADPVVATGTDAGNFDVVIEG